MSVTHDRWTAQTNNSFLPAFSGAPVSRLCCCSGSATYPRPHQTKMDDMKTILQSRQVVVAAVATAAVVAAGLVYLRWRRPRRDYVPVGHVSKIYVHPVKACRGLEVQQAQVTKLGVWSGGVMDRDLIILDETGRFVTARTEPRIVLISPQCVGDGQVRLKAPGMDPCTVPKPDLRGEVLEISMKDGMVGHALSCDPQAGQWLDKFFGKQGYRMVMAKPGGQKRYPVNSKRYKEVARADDKGEMDLGLKTALESRQIVVAALATAAVATAGVAYLTWRRSRRQYVPVGHVSKLYVHPVKSCRGLEVGEAEVTKQGLRLEGVMDRHLLVLDEKDRFVTARTEPSMILITPRCVGDGQDCWQYVRIGTAEFRKMLACNRCLITTVNPETGVKEGQEPLHTLRSYRLPEDEKQKRLFGQTPLFGLMRGVEQEGSIHVGDTVYACV
ncbi:PREDICTED: mitochondrial amidoxime-reducing component 1-like [Branchiostoma belcheri]|uniref:Mitochondrial amidoxime-reducing component 1-like n=1 Tax=Branchiostoma belcheri TaxID=7741 RepID=A0A6P4XZ73_BRABE|nr:PREDICTED: mitochondrial amidoxime-reducing component 1-like [Branchiostoma belcheri]